MIQEIYPHCLKIEYQPLSEPRDESCILCFSGRKVLCKIDETGEWTIPDFKLYKSFFDISHFDHSCFADSQTGVELSTEDQAKNMPKYLFSLDDREFFLAEDDFTIPDGFEFREMNLFRSAQPKEISFAIVTAYHLSDWYSINRFCGRCRTPTVHDGQERMLRCPNCGNMIYPKIMPSVIVGVKNGDSILLTKYNRPGARLSALVAGFTEIGETAEDTVRREVMEEVGLKVKNIRYYKSQPWGISAGGLLLGFWCDVDEDTTIHVDGFELADAKWIKREELLKEFSDPGVSLTMEMIMAFAHGEE